MKLISTIPDHLCDEQGRLIHLPPPEAVPDQATYERERERALAYSVERRENYERFQASDRRQIQPDYLPTRIDVENVSRCNFRCTMCQVSEWAHGQRAQDLSLDEFKRLIDQQYGLVEIKIQGLGEPTLQGDAFFEMIRYARERAIWVRVVTNASLLHLADNHRKLIDSGVNEVQISIDGATQEVYESIRHGSKFEQVVKNCRLVNDYCRELGIERTKMWTVVQRKNAHQVRDIIRLGEDMGFRSMAFSLHMVDFGLDHWRAVNDAASIASTFTNQEAMEHTRFGEERGLKVRFWRQTEKYDTDRPENLCPWPFERGYVSSDQRVVPCCILGNPDVAELGSAVDLTRTWQAAEWQDFRKAHLDGRIPEVCKSCYRSGELDEPMGSSPDFA